MVTLMLMLCTIGADPDYSPVQIEYLEGHKLPWVIPDVPQKIEFHADNISYGHRLEFKRSEILITEAPDGTRTPGKEQSVSVIDIHAVPYKGEVYWFNAFELEQFEWLGRGQVFATKRADFMYSAEIFLGIWLNIALIIQIRMRPPAPRTNPGFERSVKLAVCLMFVSGIISMSIVLLAPRFFPTPLLTPKESILLLFAPMILTSLPMWCLLATNHPEKQANVATTA